MVRVQEVSWSEGRAVLIELRTEVFVGEQACPVREEFDGLDEGAAHLLAWWGDEAVGCARVRGAKIERMAVRKPYRGRGIALALLDRAIEVARRSAERPVHLHAQVAVTGLYARRGFAVCGEQFMEAGIRHLPMRLEEISSGT